MNKIFAFIILFPFLSVLLFNGVFLYEQDTKFRYLKDEVDNIAYKVKITGKLTSDEINDFKDKINNMADFSNSDCIQLYKGIYSNGTVSINSPYLPGEQLEAGDAFVVFVQSKNVTIYSKLTNWGVSQDDSKNIYYKAKAQCRIEYSY